jgi:iron complex transport system substrate-binding protein
MTLPFRLMSAVTASTITLAACATTTPASAPSVTPLLVTSATQAPVAWPVTIDNCGFDLTLDAAPERIVAIKSTTTELLIELGLADRILGAAFLDGPLDTPYTQFEGEITEISDFTPGQEAVLAMDPDMIFAGWESNFSADAVGERDALQQRGIASYVAPSACKGADYQPHPMTFEALFAQIEEAGVIFDAPDAAADLVATMRSELAAVSPKQDGLSAVWFSSGSDTPYVGAGIGAPQMMMEASGLTNIMADVQDTWTPATWEAVVAADPDVMILVDADWNTAASKIDMLTSSPATSSLAAVQNEAFVIVPFAAAEAGVRNVQAVRSIVEQLDALDVETRQ